MKNLFRVCLLILLSKAAFAQTVAPYNPVQLNQASWYYEPTTGDRYIYNGSTYKWTRIPYSYASDGVVTGMGLSVAGSTLTVASGSWRISNVVYSKSTATTITLPAADATLSRYVTVYATNTSTVSSVNGTLSANPVEASIPAGSTRIGAALITPTSTTTGGGGTGTVAGNNGLTKRNGAIGMGGDLQLPTTIYMTTLAPLSLLDSLSGNGLTLTPSQGQFKFGGGNLTINASGPTLAGNNILFTNFANNYTWGGLSDGTAGRASWFAHLQVVQPPGAPNDVARLRDIDSVAGSYMASNYVPYVNAGLDVNLGIRNLTASTLIASTAINNYGPMNVMMSPPGVPTLTPSATGGTLAAGTYSYTVTAIDAVSGETIASTSASVTLTGTTSSVGISWPAVPGAAYYWVYRNNTVRFIGNTGTSITDIGAAGAAKSAPTTGTAYYSQFTSTGNQRLGGALTVASTVTGSSFIGALNYALTPGYGLTGSAFSNIAAQTWVADTTKLQTITNFFPKADTRYYKSSNPSAYIALTALSATAPLAYSNTTGAFTITQANTATNGYLSSTDWNTFNGKAPAFTGTGYSKFAAGVLSYVTAIPNTDLANSSLTLNGVAIALGATGTITANTTNSHTNGYGLTGGAFNGSAPITWAVDTLTKISTILGVKDSLLAHAATIGAGLSNTSNTLSVNQGYAFTFTANETFNGGLTAAGNFSKTAWANNAPTAATGANLNIGASQTVTDNSSLASSTTTWAFGNVFSPQTFAATNTGVTYTNAATVAILGNPAAGANVTISNPMALYVTGGQGAFLNGVGTSANGQFANFFAQGGSVGGNTSAAATPGMQYAGSTGINSRASAYGNIASTPTAGYSYSNFHIGQSPVTIAASSTTPWMSQLVVNKFGTVTLNTGAAITNSALIYLGDPTTPASNIYAIYAANGLSAFNHIGGNSGAPTIVAGTGAGTTPTISITGTDVSGTITLTTGTAPAGTNAPVATVTFNSAYGAAPRIMLDESNTNAQGLVSTTAKVIIPASGQTNGVTTTTFTIQGGATALAASTQYVWTYMVTQ